MEIERILIVGLGSIGRRHAQLFREILPAAKLVALRHQDSGDYGVVDYCVTNIERALEFRPQLALIANPASHHLEVALPLARAGVHLLIEKPISNSTKGVVELVKECEARKVSLMTGYNLRFLPSLQKFRKLVLSGRVGPVLSVRAEIGQWLPDWRPSSDYRQTVSAQQRLGGGALLELSHEIDYLCWLFGDAEWVSAFKMKVSDLEIDVEDTAHVVLGFKHQPEDNKIVANLNMDFVRHDTTRSCTVIGANGTLKWDAISGTVKVYEAGAKSWQTLYSNQESMSNSYPEELKHFLSCIDEGTAPLISGVDGLRVLEVIEAINQSAAAGRIAYLDFETNTSGQE